nr:glycosyltransferase family 2 protein [uncultured Flavobacterium sp.]
MKTALLISTYNWPQALEVIFKSILNQTKMPDQILIADDGSREDTKQVIEKFKNQIKVPVLHFWQEDIGFRKSKILNKAIAGSSADYIIQIDGDCIMHPQFIKDHISHAQKNVYLYGSRVNIKEQAVATIFNKQITNFNLFSSEIKNKTRTLHIPFLSNLYKSHAGISKKFRGCNVSYWKSDFIDINGYNEDFEGWGREDSDLAIRLGNKGVLAKRLRYAGIVFHIWHKVKSKENLDKNDSIEKQTIANKTVKITNGVNKYL